MEKKACSQLSHNLHQEIIAHGALVQVHMAILGHRELKASLVNFQDPLEDQLFAEGVLPVQMKIYLSLSIYLENLTLCS